MVWGEKGDVDLLCCSSVVGTWLAMATVKNDKKSLKITSCSRDVGQFFSSDCTVTQSYAKGTNSRRTPALREKGIFPWGGHSVPARGHPPEGQQSRQTASPEALCGLCVFSSDSGAAFIEGSEESIPYTIISSSKQLKDKFWAVHLWCSFTHMSSRKWHSLTLSSGCFFTQHKDLFITLQKHLSHSGNLCTTFWVFFFPSEGIFLFY